MLATLALLSALSATPQQNNDLKITNIRPTHGLGGAVRKSTKLVPGDIFFLSFDLEGLKVGDDGKTTFFLGMELRDKNDKLVFGQEPQKKEEHNTLGGDKRAAWVSAEIGTDTEPGKYKLVIIVKSADGKTEKKESKEFEVAKPELGIVRTYLSLDAEGNVPAPPRLVPGQRVAVHFFTAGFGRDDKNKQPNLSVAVRILEKGKAVLKKGITGTVTNAPANFKLIPWDFVLDLNRAGTFTIELKVTDNVAKKDTTETIDITVEPIK